MADSLRTLLSSVDYSAEGIQRAAGAMMKHYDRSSSVAVVEWRNSLHNAPLDKHMPLLYVANEVLQNSKRNRGNKFLEAFSPVLGQSLVFIVQKDRNKIEKVRRTVKIWGDRQVFSHRFIAELLKGLDAYRVGGTGYSSSAVASSSSIHDDSHQLNYHNHRIHTANTSSTVANTPTHSTGTGSTPQPPLSSPHSPAQQGAENDPKSSPATRLKDETELEEEDPMDILNDHDEEDDDDDDNLFGQTSERKLQLDISSFSANGIGNEASTTPSKTTMKRRRSSNASNGSAPASKKGRKKSILSTNSIVDLWKQVSELDQNYEDSQAARKRITEWILSDEAQTLDSLVGEELLDMYKRVLKYQEELRTERKTLHRIASERKNLEIEAMRYLPWLENGIKQDEEDVKFCRFLQKQLLSFKHIHGSIRTARDKRLQEELQHRKELQERERKKREEEEQNKFREIALKSETEAQQGMVWNPNTREYQYLNTDESWRD